MIRLKGKQTGDSLDFEEGFIEFLKVVFAHKRKTVLNNLSYMSENSLDRSELVEILEKAEINEMARAEELALEKLRQVYALLSGKS